jgi:hypothetical protein
MRLMLRTSKAKSLSKTSIRFTLEQALFSSGQVSRFGSG